MSLARVWKRSLAAIVMWLLLAIVFVILLHSVPLVWALLAGVIFVLIGTAVILDIEK